jgi:mevalonate kinase
MTQLQIPGKVMLSGEYAVLYGGTAVMASVPCYLLLKESDAGNSSDYPPVVRHALELHIDEISDFESKNGLPEIELDNSQFFSADSEGHRLKLGLGLSAAEAVGTTALRFERAGLSWEDNREKIIKYAFKAHNQAQGGLGSGADIAACAFAHPIKFRRTEEKLHVEPIEGDLREYKLPLKLAWTGMPSDTRNMVAAFEKWAKSGDRNLLKQLIASANDLADAWFRQPLDELFEKIDDFSSHLRQISKSADIPLYLPIHDELEEWARRNGGRAKPTGAGGGDMILIIGDLPVRHPEDTLIPLML